MSGERAQVALPEGAVLVAGDREYPALTIDRNLDYESVRYEAHSVPDESWRGTCPACARVHQWTKSEAGRWVITAAVTRNDPYYCGDCHDEHDDITWVCTCGYRVVPIYRREAGGVMHRLASDETSVAVLLTSGEVPSEVVDAEVRYVSAEGHRYVIPMPKTMRFVGDVVFENGAPPTATLTGATPVSAA